MFGDDPDGASAETLRICCGPRCGVWPGHRRIYDAAERAASLRDAAARPTMCQGLCGSGVTLVLPDGSRVKADSPAEAAAVVTASPETNSAR